MDKLKVYNTTENIKLMLTPEEARKYGVTYFGIIDKDETKLIKKLLNKGDVFIDIGAYIDGWHSLLAAKLVGPEGKVYTFEPLYFDRLKDNIKLNNLTNITLSELAVYSNNGMQYFYDGGGRSSLFKEVATIEENKNKKIKVKMIMLDDYVKENGIDLEKIKLIKIDVEGAEVEVLKGAKKLLERKNAPDLIIEVVEDNLKLAGSSKEELLNFLEKSGYKHYKLDDKNINLFFSKQIRFQT